MKRKIIWLLLVAMLLTGALAGCGGTLVEADPAAPSGEENTLVEAPVETEPAEEPPAEEAPDDPAGIPAVYMTTDISADSLIAIYEALEASPTGNIAVKLSTGEPGSNYLRTDLIGPLVQSFDDPTIVECNTAYGGSRANTAMHY